MQSILELLEETNMITDNLSDSQIVEIYKCTTEEEKEQYTKVIQDLLENIRVPDNIHELCSAVSYLNIEAYIYKNNLI